MTYPDQNDRYNHEIELISCREVRVRSILFGANLIVMYGM